ncbi:MAG: SprT-like domain-containing protein, partial [Deltaproteobacteria bacterium]|nr:SprT-like domain-containing protein [Deltaproteobacteria bacterium]
LWSRATEEERRQTVIHEVCHLVAHHESILTGRSLSGAHGYEWKNVMRRAGVTPKRCHNVSNKGLSSRRRIPAKCACKDHELTPLVAGRILDGAKYTCRKCNAVIVVSSDLSLAQCNECRAAVARDVLRKGSRPARRRR